MDDLGFDPETAVSDSLGAKAPGEPIMPPTMQSSMSLAVGTKPDYQAELNRVAKTTGVPLETVAANPDELKNKATLNSFDFDTYGRLFPASAAVLADVDFAKIAHDDTSNMSAIETGLKKLSNVGKALYIGAGPAFAEGFYGTLETGAALVGADKGVTNAKGFFNYLRQGAKNETKSITESMGPMGYVEKGIFSGVQSIGQTLPATLLAVSTGNPAPLLTVAGIGQGGQSAGNALDAGRSPLMALTYGASDAAVEVGTEMIPIAKLIGDTKVGSSLMKTLMHQVVTEVPGELVATTLQNLNEWAVLHPEKPFSSYLKELPADLGQTLIATMTAVGAQTGTVHAVSKAAGQRQIAETAEQNAQVMEHVNQFATESKLRERDPEAFQKFINQATENGPVQDIYINPQDLAQSGIDHVQLAELSPSVQEQYQVALNTGGDIKIPLSEYAATIAPTEFGQALVDHIKTEPGGMSRLEAQNFTENHSAALEAEVEKVLATKQGDDTFQASRQVVQDEVLRQLTEANRFTADVNAPYANMLSNFYTVQAARLGITPEEMYKQYPVKIQAQDITGAKSLLNQERLSLPTPDTFDTPQTPDKKVMDKFSRTESVPLDKVLATETRREWDKFNNGVHPGELIQGYGDKPVAVRWSNGYYLLYDGHHRTETALNKGDSFLAMHVVDAKDYAPGTDKKPAAPGISDEELLRELGFEQATGDKRGAFNPETSTITLLAKADLSTFLHESGHFFLETLNKIASDANAPAEIKQDMDTVLHWFGVPDLATWNSYDLEQQRDYHEKFARGFESYLFEGKSPNIEMQGVFQRFRAWLLSVYKSIKALNVEMSEDVRGVFDRMLATSEQIREAEASRNFAPVFSTAEEAGMAPEEFKAYHDLGMQATQDAISNLETRSLRDMQWTTNAKGRVLKAMQRDAAAKRKVIKQEVTDEVMNEPINQARRFLKKGEYVLPGDANKEERRRATELGVVDNTKLSLPALKEMYGDEGNAIWRNLTTGQYGYIANEGLAPDMVADMFGFSSGDELVRSLLAAENAKEKINALTDQRMLERYGDLTDQQAMERAADAAIHNEARTRFVATEMNALQKASGGKKILASAAKQFAETMIARLKVRELNANRYATAEARAAKAADTARRKGDLATAATEKRNQLVQGYATSAVYSAQEEIEKGLRYLGKFDREGSRKKIDVDYLDQVDVLLDRFDLRKNVSLKAIDKRKSLNDWLKSQEEMGLEPDIDPAMLNEANRKHYKDMTVEEFRGLLDTVRQIDHLGRLKNRLLTAKDNRDFATIVEQLVYSIKDHAGDKRVENRTRPTAGDRAVRLYKGFLAQHRKVASLVRELDGFKDGGPMWETFVRSMNEAGDKETTMREQATVKLAELIKPLREGGNMGGKGVFFPSIGHSLNREERIGVALNTGNLGNFQRLLDGEGWTYEQVAPVLDMLTKNDWDFVQSIWDTFESYRPQIAAKERRIYGREPIWVEPNPVNTKFGEYRGGYYPIKYDARLSAAAEQHSDAELAKQQLKGAYTSSTTRRSFTKARADEVKGRPLLLSMDGLYGGLNEVIHDLSWHEWLIDANRLLRSKSLDHAIRSRYGADVVKQFKDGMKDIAAGEMPTGDAMEKVLGNLRAGATIATMGLNIMNTVINVTGLTQSMVRIGPKWVAQGIGAWAQSPIGLITQIHEKSEFMRTRGKTQQREINEIRSLVQGKNNARQVIDRIMFLPVTMTQMAVDSPTWWGAYQKATAEGEEDSRAIALADQAVIDAQGSGMVKDLASIQRGGPYKKLFTTFYSFFSTTYNLTVESTKKTDFKNPLDVMRLGGDYLLLYTIPALMGTLLKSALMGGGDGEDELAKAVINDQISYLFGTLVGVRELAGAVQMATGVSQYNTGYGGPAGLRFAQEIYKLSQQVGQGEVDRALTRSAINIAGIMLHLPSTQINRTIDGIAALSEGRTNNPLAVIAGAKK